MKRISIFLITLTLGGTPVLRAQDAATEERLNKLSGQIEGILETLHSQSKQIDRLAKEVDAVREAAANKPPANYASPEDLKKLAEAIKEVDRKRIQDAENVSAQLKDLRKAVLSVPPPKTHSTSTPISQDTGDSVKPPKGDKLAKPDTESGFEYQIQEGDTLSKIVKNCKQSDKKIKVTVDQILKANPGLQADKLVPGKKIFIPAPAQS
ncbi:MAG: hypothetical protein C5B50_25310 [Verrucomicrobia bacterium]|nr:MAG: hypothetical protein C5B50_25310 [Verrucomicrobiota bacterium]